MTGSAGHPWPLLASCLGRCCSCQLGHGAYPLESDPHLLWRSGPSLSDHITLADSPLGTLWPWGERKLPLSTPLPLSSLRSPCPLPLRTPSATSSSSHAWALVSEPVPIRFLWVTPPPLQCDLATGRDPRACLYPQRQGNPGGPRVVPEGQPASQRAGPLLTSLQVSVRGAGHLSVPGSQTCLQALGLKVRCSASCLASRGPALRSLG